MSPETVTHELTELTVGDMVVSDLTCHIEGSSMRIMQGEDVSFCPFCGEPAEEL